MSAYTTKAFWAGTLERTIEVGASSALAIIGADAVGVLDVDWTGVASATALAIVLNLLRCIAQPDFISGIERIPVTELDVTPVPADYQPAHRANPDGTHGEYID